MLWTKRPGAFSLGLGMRYAGCQVQATSSIVPKRIRDLNCSLGESFLGVLRVLWKGHQTENRTSVLLFFFYLGGGRGVASKTTYEHVSLTSQVDWPKKGPNFLFAAKMVQTQKVFKVHEPRK